MYGTDWLKVLSTNHHHMQGPRRRLILHHLVDLEDEERFAKRRSMTYVEDQVGGRRS